MVETLPLYARVLGAPWSEVAEPLRRLHGVRTVVRACGRLRIERGRHPVARVISSILRLPKPNSSALVHLRIAARGDEEVWQRSFDRRRLDTRQFESGDSEIAEQYRGFEFRYRLELSGASLVYVQRQAAFRLGSFRLRMPARWAPRVEAREDPAGPRDIGVHVTIALGGVGPLITYDGTVALEDSDP